MGLIDMQNTQRKRYPWFFREVRPAGTTRFPLALVGSVVVVGVYIAYNTFSADLAPDSFLGYSYASLGTLCMLLATAGYTLARRSRKRGVGRLNHSLHWHISFGVLAIVLLVLHSFGNFNPRSGTYALYAMIALVISGFIGRLLDRVLPRQIAREVNRALTPQGDDRITTITRNMQALTTHNVQQLRSYHPQSQVSNQISNGLSSRPVSANTARGNTLLPTSWDLAYISLDETPQETARDSQNYRFVPDRRSALATPNALIPGLNDQMAELQEAREALKREGFYRSIIRYWRVLHVFLVLLTLGLTVWHLIYAAQLLLLPLMGR